jgi:prepilin-type N-terminal cleavage/methylation domain-containing protein
MEKRDHQILKNQKGFTLIEIIAVLVIMGILAAVAVPKFFELSADAEVKSYQAAGAEIQARINQNFAQKLLTNNGDCSSAIGSLSTDSIVQDLGESFSVQTATLDFASETPGNSVGITIANDDFESTTMSYTVTIPACNSDTSP